MCVNPSSKSVANYCITGYAILISGSKIDFVEINLWNHAIGIAASSDSEWS